MSALGRGGGGAACRRRRPQPNAQPQPPPARAGIGGVPGMSTGSSGAGGGKKRKAAAALPLSPEFQDDEEDDPDFVMGGALLLVIPVFACSSCCCSYVGSVGWEAGASYAALPACGLFPLLACVLAQSNSHACIPALRPHAPQPSASAARRTGSRCRRRRRRARLRWPTRPACSRSAWPRSSAGCVKNGLLVSFLALRLRVGLRGHLPSSSLAVHRLAPPQPQCPSPSAAPFLTLSIPPSFFPPPAGAGEGAGPEGEAGRPPGQGAGARARPPGGGAAQAPGARAARAGELSVVVCCWLYRQRAWGAGVQHAVGVLLDFCRPAAGSGANPPASCPRPAPPRPCLLRRRSGWRCCRRRSGSAWRRFGRGRRGRSEGCGWAGPAPVACVSLLQAWF